MILAERYNSYLDDKERKSELALIQAFTDEHNNVPCETYRARLTKRGCFVLRLLGCNNSCEKFRPVEKNEEKDFLKQVKDVRKRNILKKHLKEINARKIRREISHVIKELKREGIPDEEIAEYYGIKLNTVKTIIARGI